MTPAELAFWQRANARASRLTPQLAVAYLAAFAFLAKNFDNPKLVEMIQNGDVEGVIRTALSDTAFAIAFAGVRDNIRTITADAVRYFGNDIPGARVGGQLTIGFDYLNPRVIDAMRTMETRQLDTLKLGIRDAFRAFITDGLRNGDGAATIAREIRSIVGLAPNQVLEAANFRAKLAAGDFAGALGYELRDKRFDPTLRALQLSGKKLTPAQVETMAQNYLRKKIAFNATTNARTAATNALKLGQVLSWEDAVEKGIVDQALVEGVWHGMLDGIERPAHVRMEGATMPIGGRFSNGQRYPGETDFNCRCWTVWRIKASPA